MASLLSEVCAVIDCEHKTAPRAGSEEKFGVSIGTMNVRDGRLLLDDAKPVNEQTFRDWTRRAVPEPGDLILSREAPMGEVGAVPIGSKVCLGQRTVLLRPRRDLVDPDYLRYLLMSPQTQHWIAACASGSTVLHVNVADVRRIPLGVLPDLQSQRRTVEVVEDHLSRIDAATTTLRTSLQRLEFLRRLVVTELATGARVPLKSLAVDSRYGTSVKCEVRGTGRAVVRIPNLLGGRIDLSDEKRAADPSVDLTSVKLEAGDVLIVRTNGSKDLIGRSGVVQEGVDAAFASYLIRYRVDSARIRPAWLHTMLGTPTLRAEIERLAASSAGQYNLSLSKLDGLMIPTPALGEQDAALARLAELDDHCAVLHRGLNEALRRSDDLRSGLLAAAFRG